MKPVSYLCVNVLTGETIFEANSLAGADGGMQGRSWEFALIETAPGVDFYTFTMSDFPAGVERLAARRKIIAEFLSYGVDVPS